MGTRTELGEGLFEGKGGKNLLAEKGRERGKGTCGGGKEKREQTSRQI